MRNGIRAYFEQVKAKLEQGKFNKQIRDTQLITLHETVGRNG